MWMCMALGGRADIQASLLRLLELPYLSLFYYIITASLERLTSSRFTQPLLGHRSLENSLAPSTICSATNGHHLSLAILYAMSATWILLRISSLGTDSISQYLLILTWVRLVILEWAVQILASNQEEENLVMKPAHRRRTTTDVMKQVESTTRIGLAWWLQPCSATQT